MRVNYRCGFLLAIVLAARPAVAHDFECERTAGVILTGPDAALVLGPDGLPGFQGSTAHVLKLSQYPALVGIETKLTNLASDPSVVRSVLDPALDPLGARVTTFGTPIVPGLTLPVGGSATSIQTVQVASQEECLALLGGKLDGETCALDRDDRLVVGHDAGSTECRARVVCAPPAPKPPTCDARWGSTRPLDFLPSSVAVDGCSPVIGGLLPGNTGGTTSDGVLAWLDANGAPVREYQVVGRFFGRNEVTSVAIGDAGDVYITLRSEGFAIAPAHVGPGDVTVTRYRADGSPVWIHGVATRNVTDPDIPVGTGAVLFAGGALWAVASPPLQLTRLDPVTGDIVSTTPFAALFPSFSEPLSGTAGSAVDAAGDVYLVASALTAPAGTVPGDQFDPLITKVGKDGKVVWSKRFATPIEELVEGIAVDGAGDVYVVGLLVRPALSGPPHDAFLTKIDADGNVLWDREIPGSATVEVAPRGVAVTRDGDVRVFGTLFPTLAPLGHFFAGDTGSEWIAAFDPSGALRWAQQLAPAVIDRRLGLDAAGHAYVAETQVPSASFVVKLDKDGNVQ